MRLSSKSLIQLASPPHDMRARRQLCCSASSARRSLADKLLRSLETKYDISWSSDDNRGVWQITT